MWRFVSHQQIYYIRIVVSNVQHEESTGLLFFILFPHRESFTKFILISLPDSLLLANTFLFVTLKVKKKIASNEQTDFMLD